MTTIKACDTKNCTSSFQDKTYGKQNRVHNMCGPKSDPKWRCTVCASVKS